MNAFSYVGTELELFAEVHNWKTYWSGEIRPFVVGDVLEVGAGIGANTPYLIRGDSGRWVCLEPDRVLADQLESALLKSRMTARCEVVCGTLQSLNQDRFDTVLYIDVLEHIKTDREELQDAAGFLKPGGRLIVLSPAHQSLFSEFDAAIGHFRRYNRRRLARISPESLLLEKMWYVDSGGLLLSVANKILLRQAMPTKVQLHFWDRWVIPISRFGDQCSFGHVGKSIIAIWKR